MPEPVLLKLGGSVLTKKGGPGIVRQENLALISREIAGHARYRSLSCMEPVPAGIRKHTGSG